MGKQRLMQELGKKLCILGVLLNVRQELPARLQVSLLNQVAVEIPLLYLADKEYKKAYLEDVLPKKVMLRRDQECAWQWTFT